MEQRSLPLTNIGERGLNTDLASSDIDLKYITDGANFRVYAGKLLSMADPLLWHTMATTQSDVGRVFNFRLPDTTFFWLTLSNKAIAFNGSIESNVNSTEGSPTYTGVTADNVWQWSSCKLGAIPIVNHTAWHPEYWHPVGGTTKLQLLKFDATHTWKDKGFSAGVIRSHKTVLFALNLQEGAVSYPDSFRWSHPADINGLPFTWDETDLSATAGKASLGANGGSIVDGLSMRDAFVIYSERAVDILTPSYDEFVWNRRRLADDYTIASKDCVVDVSGTHYVLGIADIYINDGNTIKSITTNRIRRRLAANFNITAAHNAYAFRHVYQKEIWFCVPEHESHLPNTAYIYDYEQDAWSVTSLPDGASFTQIGPIGTPPPVWSDFPEPWSSVTVSWSQIKALVKDYAVISVLSANGNLIQDDAPTYNSSNSFVERRNGALVAPNVACTVTSVYPRISCVGEVIVQIGSQSNINGAVLWENEVVFNPSNDDKVDVLSTGNLHCWRIKSVNSAAWELSGMDFEFTVNGKR